VRSRRHETFGFQTAIADRAPLGASPRVDHYCLLVRESQFALGSSGLVPPAAGVLLALGRRRGRCLDPRARPPGGAVRNRGPARAGFASRVPRVVRRFCGFFWTCRRAVAGPRAGARGRGGSRGRARGGATLERRAKMTRHQCTMSYCTFGMIAAWAIRPADSRSRGLTGSL